MNKFKVQDRVRVIMGTFKGKEGTIRQIDYETILGSDETYPKYLIDFDDVKVSLATIHFLPAELEKI